MTWLNQTKLNHLICLTYEGKNRKSLTTRFYQQPPEVYITNHEESVGDLLEVIPPVSGQLDGITWHPVCTPNLCTAFPRRGCMDAAEMVGLVRQGAGCRAMSSVVPIRWITMGRGWLSYFPLPSVHLHPNAHRGIYSVSFQAILQCNNSEL